MKDNKPLEHKAVDPLEHKAVEHPEPLDNLLVKNPLDKEPLEHNLLDNHKALLTLVEHLLGALPVRSQHHKSPRPPKKLFHRTQGQNIKNETRRNKPRTRSSKLKSSRIRIKRRIRIKNFCPKPHKRGPTKSKRPPNPNAPVPRPMSSAIAIPIPRRT